METGTLNASISGQKAEIPDDLFIPPDALEVLLESFSGPLDLLLYLIRKQNIDILNIPMVSITNQYISYIQLMEKKRLNLAADYLVMAAVLAEIKSRCLLPVTVLPGEEESDPRLELVRRLQEYETMKEAACLLDNLPRLGRDFIPLQYQTEGLPTSYFEPEVVLSHLLDAMKDVLAREDTFQHHQITSEPMTVRERMATILAWFEKGKVFEFKQILEVIEGRGGIVITLLALLELTRQSLLILNQLEPFSPLYIEAYATSG
jgi:segregation and condensation protein A